MAAKVVKTALVVPSSEPDSESMDDVPKFRSASEQTDPLVRLALLILCNNTLICQLFASFI